ncbi:MAG: hypothetical protein CVV10_06500 [Gammaproteobacteria bacterium HGW-Gammaproteobacteria-14]|nr:MAG: hypothetical protein CVV10_06500 [Gammaproteobacteria bacterium HGW-Gammaproteobacteria-14]
MAFHGLIRLDQLYDGYRGVFRIGREEILLLQQEGRVYLLDNRCPHQGFPLDRGTLRGERLICPRHGFAFHIERGDCFQASSCSLRIWSVAYQGSVIGVEF